MYADGQGLIPTSVAKKDVMVSMTQACSEKQRSLTAAVTSWLHWNSRSRPHVMPPSLSVRPKLAKSTDTVVPAGHKMRKGSPLHARWYTGGATVGLRVSPTGVGSGVGAAVTGEVVGERVGCLVVGEFVCGAAVGCLVVGWAVVGERVG